MHRLTILMSALLLSTAARAAPIQDVQDWAQRFTQAAERTDIDQIIALTSDAAAPGLNTAGFPQLFQSAKAVIGAQVADGAEQFSEQNVGTFLKRINVAVSYPGSYIFYSVTFGRHSEGWLIYSIKVDGNINNILNAPWPG